MGKPQTIIIIRAVFLKLLKQTTVSTESTTNTAAYLCLYHHRPDVQE